jgi:hypothetical protein
MLIHLPQNSTLYIEQEDNTSKSTELVNTTQRRSMDLSDVEALEAAEAQLDQFIEKRAREREEANRVEAAWALSEARHRARSQGNGYRPLMRWLPWCTRVTAWTWPVSETSEGVGS